VDRLDDLEETRPVGLEAGLVVLPTARDMRGKIGIDDLVLGARSDADPGAAGVLDRREHDAVIETDQVGFDLSKSLDKFLLHINRSSDDGVPEFEGLIRDLLVCRKVNIQDVRGDEVPLPLARGVRVHRLGHGD